MPPIATESPLPTDDIQSLQNLEEWDRINFWSSYGKFFKERGYTLYNPRETYLGYLYHEPVDEPDKSESHIYAFFSRHIPGDLKAYVPRRHIMFAQDKHKRDVAIKLVETDSVEHQIHTRLMGCTEFNRPESFPFIIPTLDILRSPHNFSFVIMPRWGDNPYLPEFRSVREILSFIENTLHRLAKGTRFPAFAPYRPPREYPFVTVEHTIAFLSIVQDIDFRNILLNQFTHTPDACNHYDQAARASLRAEGQLRYCLFDFDMSHIFPPNASASDCYLPTASVMGKGAPQHHPKDEGAELDPFKFDVACMGNVLSSDYDHIIAAFPFLAPLLDRMTTNDVVNRFTACEALLFCRFIRKSLSSMELDKELPTRATDISSPDRSSDSCTENSPDTSGSAFSCDELNNIGSTPLVSSLLSESTPGKKQPGLWDELPEHFVQTWSIGGQGWVRVLHYLLSLFADSDNARFKQVNSEKDTVSLKSTSRS